MMTRDEIIERLRQFELRHADPGAEYSEFWREVISALEQERWDRLEYGTDGNVYKMTISNGKEFEQEPCEDVKGGYCCRQCSHTRINKDGIWCENPTCQWEQAITTCEPCDTISREAVQMAMALDNISDIAKDIKKKLPSVQPSRKGHWIINSHGNVNCDKCGMERAYHHQSNFCPNCGADMRVKFTTDLYKKPQTETDYTVSDRTDMRGCYGWMRGDTE